MMRYRPMRRPASRLVWSWVPLIALLVGCSSDPAGRFGLIQDVVFPPEKAAYPRTVDEVGAYPFAQLGVVPGSGQPGIAVLAEYVQGNYRWVASGSFFLISSPDGRILSYQLSTESIRVAWPDIDAGSAPVGSVYQIEVFRSAVVAASPSPVSLTCRVSDRKQASIRVLERSIDVTHSLHECQAPSSERVMHEYWTDASGRMRRFTGRILPATVRFKLETLKAPA